MNHFVNTTITHTLTLSDDQMHQLQLLVKAGDPLISSQSPEMKQLVENVLAVQTLWNLTSSASS